VHVCSLDSLYVYSAGQCRTCISSCMWCESLYVVRDSVGGRALESPQRRYIEGSWLLKHVRSCACVRGCGCGARWSHIWHVRCLRCGSSEGGGPLDSVYLCPECCVFVHGRGFISSR